MEIENFVEQELIKRNIVFKRNINIKRNRRNLVEFDFIIPGAVIEVKTSYFDDNYYDRMKQLTEQIKRQQSFIPHD